MKNKYSNDPEMQSFLEEFEKAFVTAADKALKDYNYSKMPLWMTSFDPRLEGMLVQAPYDVSSTCFIAPIIEFGKLRKIKKLKKITWFYI